MEAQVQRAGAVLMGVLALATVVVTALALFVRPMEEETIATLLGVAVVAIGGALHTYVHAFLGEWRRS